MDNLPEEVLDLIIGHVATVHDPLLTPPETTTLYSLCRTSWRLYRIARPYLYAHVHSCSGAMGRQFLDTIAAQPVLANCVKQFAVKHTTEGCFKPMEATVDQEELYGTVTDTCVVLLIETLENLSMLEVLDLSRFAKRADSRSEWLAALTTLVSNQPNQPLLFSNLRHLSVHLGAVAVYELLPFFGLPQLRSLEVDIRKRGFTTQMQPGTTQSYPVSCLRIIGFTNAKLVQVSWLAVRFPALDSLFVSTGINDSKFIGRAFAKNIESGSLKTIQVAVPGLWHYEVETMEARVSDEELAGDLYNALVYATGAEGVVKGRIEIPPECQSVRSVSIRELTEAEKKAYDDRRPRRP